MFNFATHIKIQYMKKNKNNKTEVFSIRTTKEERESLVQLANKGGKKFTVLVRELIQQFIKDNIGESNISLVR